MAIQSIAIQHPIDPRPHMTKVVYIEFSGKEHVIDVENGETLMQAAVDNRVPGIIGDCGGSCTCATCHAYVDAAWLGKLPAASEDETMTLEGALDVEPNSRLTCQLVVKPELDGIVIRLPKSQF